MSDFKAIVAEIDRDLERVIDKSHAAGAADRRSDTAAVNSVVAALQKIDTAARRDIKESDQRVPEERLLLAESVVQILRHSIEDNKIDLAAHWPSLANSLRSFIKSEDDWRPLLQECHQIIRSKEIPVYDVELALPAWDIGVRASLARNPGSKIQVSSSQYPLVPILDDSLSDPERAMPLLRAFLSRLHQIRNETNFTAMCFVEKSTGPVGALFLLPFLVDQLKVPAFFYRESYWAKRSQVAGSYRPQPNDRVVIIYDLVVTGGGIQHIAEELSAEHDATVPAALVLFEYPDAPSELPYQKLGGKERTVVHSLGRYSDFEPEIASAQKGVNTAHIKHIGRNRRGARNPSASSLEGSDPPSRDGVQMADRTRQTTWRPSITAYQPKELRTLTFRSERQIDEAIRLIWEDPELEGIPNDIAGGMSLVVPADAVPIFESKRLRFTVDRILGSADLSTEQLRTLRNRFGM